MDPTKKDNLNAIEAANAHTRYIEQQKIQMCMHNNPNPSSCLEKQLPIAPCPVLMCPAPIICPVLPIKEQATYSIPIIITSILSGVAGMGIIVLVLAIIRRNKK